MRTPLTSPKRNNEFVPRIEMLEERCTPIATVQQFGNAVLIIADPTAGGLISIQDNGTSNTGAIKVFSNGVSVFSLDGTKVNAAQPITVAILGSNQNDTVVYTLNGNLTTDSTQLPTLFTPNTMGQNPNESGGRVILANLFGGKADTFRFDWPFQQPTTGVTAEAASGLLDGARLNIQATSSAKTEFLSTNFNIDAFNAGIFVGLNGGKGVDHIAVNENIFDLTGTTGSSGNFPQSNSANVFNATVLNAAQSQTGSQLVLLPVVVSGTSTSGATLSDQNIALAFGNRADLATVPVVPFVTLDGLNLNNVLFI
jgi:hypothetical protein